MLRIARNGVFTHVRTTAAQPEFLLLRFPLLGTKCETPKLSQTIAHPRKLRHLNSQSNRRLLHVLTLRNLGESRRGRGGG